MSVDSANIHDIIRNNCSVEELVEFIHRFPDCLRYYDNNRLLPLHTALLEHADVAIVSLLLRYYPEAAKELVQYACADQCRSDEFSALHIAIAVGASVNIVAALLHAVPVATHIASGVRGLLPLHLAAERSDNVHVVQVLLQSAPQTVKAFTIGDGEPCLPIHYAANSNNNAGVMKALLDAWPEGALEQTFKYSRLALHLAAQSSSNPAIVQMLLAAAPETVKAFDRYSWLPLHVAVVYDNSEEIVRVLLDAWPESARVRGHGGRLPLHYAAEVSTDIRVVELLLAAAPESVKMTSANSQLPIHYAARSNHCESIVEALLDAWPESVHVTCAMSLQALHLAVLGNKANNVRLLLDRGASVNGEHKNGHTPLPKAKSNAVAVILRQVIETSNYVWTMLLHDLCYLLCVVCVSREFILNSYLALSYYQ